MYVVMIFVTHRGNYVFTVKTTQFVYSFKSSFTQTTGTKTVLVNIQGCKYKEVETNSLASG